MSLQAIAYAQKDIAELKQRAMNLVTAMMQYSGFPMSSIYIDMFHHAESYGVASNRHDVNNILHLLENDANSRKQLEGEMIEALTILRYSEGSYITLKYIQELHEYLTTYINCAELCESKWMHLYYVTKVEIMVERINNALKQFDGPMKEYAKDAEGRYDIRYVEEKESKPDGHMVVEIE